jgi:hypothetical protein
LPSVLAAVGVDPPGGDVVGVDPLGLADGPLAGCQRVAVLLIDGLGWHQLQTVTAQTPILAEAAAGRLGTLRRLTTGFPATTPTSLVSFGTGAPPGSTGILGFTVRIPGTQSLLNHVAWRDDPDPHRWQPMPSLLERALASGVDVSVASRPEFVGSGLTVAAYGDVPYRPAANPEELATALLAALRASPGPMVAYGYHPDLDRAGHRHGLASAEWQAAAAEVDRLIARVIEELPPDAALVVTADHGMVDVPLAGRFDCGTDQRLSAGVDLVGGEPRARHLYTTAGATADVVAAWREVLGAGAQVLTRDEAVAAGWFGPVPSEHLARIGDVVVAGLGSTAVMASASEPEFVTRLIGFHGSLTPVEMEIPLLIVGSVSGTR